MGIDWIDDLLEKAEGIPVLGGFAQKLRLAYEVWRVDPPNPQPVREQEQTLGSLYNQAVQLRGAFNDSLLNLRQCWTGNSAAAYLGPQLTAFQVEHDMEPAYPGAGWQMWNSLNQITSLLDYNETAHNQAGDKLQQLQSLHGDLDGQIKLAAGTLATMILLPEAEPLEDTAEAAEVAEAGETTAEMVKLGQATITLEKVAEETKEGFSLLKVISVVGTIAGIALLPFLLSGDSPANNTNPDIAYPPGIETDQQKLIYRALFFQTGNALLAAMLAKSGLSLEECEALLERYGLLTIERIVSNPNYGGSGTLLDMYRIRNIPGADKVVQDLLSSGDNANGYTGALYELWWLANHTTNVVQAQLPATGKDGNEKKGPDARLEDGTLIQLKNYRWDQAFLNDVIYPQQIKEQFEITRRNYPGQPIKFIFNGCNGTIPQAVLNTLEQLAQDGVTWDYWPPVGSNMCP